LRTKRRGVNLTTHLQNAWSYTSPPPICLQGVVLS